MYEVKYSVTLEDFRKILDIVDRAYPGIPGHPAPVWQNLTLRSMKWLVEKLPMAICLVVLLLLATTDGPIRFWHVLVVALTCIIAGINVAWVTRDDAAMRYVEGHVHRRGEHTIRLAPEGVETQQGATKSFTPWSAYTGVQIANDNIFLFHDGVANYIPASSFANEEEMTEFVRFANANIVGRPHPG